MEARVTNRKFGIEIECASPYSDGDVAAWFAEIDVPLRERVRSTHEDISQWKIVYDGSVSGSGTCRYPMEIVSPPIVGTDTAQVKAVMEMLFSKGVRANSSCGFHVHHDAGDLTDENLKSLYHLIFRYEHFIMGMLPARRIRNDYCQPFSPGEQATLNRVHDVKSWGANQNRYRGLNLNALSRHGTVEFRYWPGTMKAGDAVKWILFTQRLVEHAKTVRQPCTAKRPVVNNSCDALVAAIGLRPSKQYDHVDAELIEVGKWVKHLYAENVDNHDQAFAVVGARKVQKQRSAHVTDEEVEEGHAEGLVLDRARNVESRRLASPSRMAMVSAQSLEGQAYAMDRRICDVRCWPRAGELS